MEDERKTRKQLIAELQALRLEHSEQIRITEEKFTKAFLQNSIPTIITSAKDGRVVEVSDAFLRLSGLKRNEVIGRTMIEGGFITQEQRETFLNELTKSGRVENIEMAINPQGKGWRYGLFNVVMISINNANYLLTTIQDITDRKQAEEALRESERRYRFLAENMADIVWTIGMDLRPTYVSPSITKVLGVTPEERSGHSLQEMMTPASCQQVAALLADELRRDREPGGDPDRSIVFDVEYLHAAGHIVPMENYVRAIRDAAGSIIGIYGTSRDITKGKQLEKEKLILEAQNRQLLKSESLGRMAGAIAHHFNNQLAIVMGSLEMAMFGLPQNAEPIESMNAAMKAADRAAQMTGKMLTYLGQSFGKRDPLDISETCNWSLPLLRAVMPENIGIETDFPSPGPVIVANANEIQQVMSNLVINAWESAGQCRCVIYLKVRQASLTETLSRPRYPIDWQPQGNSYTCLEVADKGCGIDDKDIEKLFDPFFTTKFAGRGMGLAVVLGIVKAHGGVITVESEQGVGSTFRVFFPVSESGLPQPQNAVSEDNTLHSAVFPTKFEEGGTVLLVEDEEMARNLAAAMLNRLGFAVLEAKDGVEALELFRQHQDEIKFVLSDLTMPHMNGWETLTALRKIKPDIPLILASGYDITQVMSGDHPELPQAFLGKPYRLNGLRDAISQALEKRPKTDG